MVVGMNAYTNSYGYGFSQSAYSPNFSYPYGNINFTGGINKNIFQNNYKKNESVSFWEGLKAFGKGVLNPLKNALKHPFKTAAVIAASAALIIGTGGAATPLLIGAGVLMGGWQLGKGTINAITSDTKAETLAALEDMGEGTFTLGASMMGAKSYVTSTGAQSATVTAAGKTGWAKVGTYVKGLGQDTVTTIKAIPESACSTWDTLVSGDLMANVKHFKAHTALQNEKKTIDAMESSSDKALALKAWKNKWNAYKATYGTEAPAQNNLNYVGNSYGQLNRFLNMKNFPIDNTILGINSGIAEDPEVANAIQTYGPIWGLNTAS